MSASRLSRAEMAVVNLLTSILAWGWPVLLSLVITPLLVRELGADAYGVRGLIISITGYFALLDLGLNAAGTKYLAEYQAKGNKPLIIELLGTTLTTFTVAGLLGGGFIWALAGWFSNTVFTIPTDLQVQSVWAFRLAGVGFFVSMITWWGSSIPTGLQRFDVFNGISVGFGTITSLGSLVAVLLGYGLIGVVCANVLSNIIAVIAYVIAARKLLPGILIRFSFDWEMFKRTTIFGFYMVLFRIFGIIFTQLDRTLIGIWLGTAALTFYLVPHQIASMVHQVNAKMMQIVFPMASEFSAAMDQGKVRRLFLRGTNLSVVAGLGIAVPVVALARPLLQFWLSPEFAEKSTVVLSILAVTYLLMGLTAVTTSVLGGIGYPQLVTIGSATSGISALLSYWLLIKLWGINGAALATTLGMVITIVYYLVACKWLVGVSLLTLARTVFRPLLIALAIGVPTLQFVAPRIDSLRGVLVAAALVAGVYGLACWFLDVFDSEEKRSLLKLVGRFVPWLRPEECDERELGESLEAETL